MPDFLIFYLELNSKFEPRVTLVPTAFPYTYFAPKKSRFVDMPNNQFPTKFIVRINSEEKVFAGHLFSKPEFY